MTDSIWNFHERGTESVRITTRRLQIVSLLAPPYWWAVARSSYSPVAKQGIPYTWRKTSSSYKWKNAVDALRDSIPRKQAEGASFAVYDDEMPAAFHAEQRWSLDDMNKLLPSIVHELRSSAEIWSFPSSWWVLEDGNRLRNTRICGLTNLSQLITWDQVLSKDDNNLILLHRYSFMT